MQVEDVILIFQLDVIARRCMRGLHPSPAASIDQGSGLVVGWSKADWGFRSSPEPDPAFIRGNY